MVYFTPSKTWADPEIIKKTKLNLDLELSSCGRTPSCRIEKVGWIEQVRRVLVPYEDKDDLMSVIDSLTSKVGKKGFVINPETPVSVLDEYLDNFTHVLFMSVHPGKQGQKFIPETLNKNIEFKKNNPEHFVEVDGGCQ
jgi:pentose-5-phosphate-3-epimerase